MKSSLIVTSLAVALLLTGCSSFIPPLSTVQTTTPTTLQTLAAEPELLTPGWHTVSGKRCYVLEDGSYAVGWLEDGGRRYYFNKYGVLQTGWIVSDEKLYYLNEDGSMARGETVINGIVYHFDSRGQRVIVVNPWNAVPGDYQPDLISLSTDISTSGISVDSSCYAPLLEMIADCNAVCPAVCVVSGYRSHAYQTNLHNRKVRFYLDQGYTQEDARESAAAVVAVPGTSEHQLGLAVDIIDTRLWDLTEEQAELPAQKWLMENSWKYGFILRYPKDKTGSTGIIYEPWHYRYVGKELAKEIFESGKTLEEYLQDLKQP